MRMADTFTKPMHPTGRVFVTIKDVLGWIGVALTRFGSRLEIYLSRAVAPSVVIGQTMIADLNQ